MEIQIQDTVEMLISKTNCEKYLKEVLTFKAEYFRDGRFHKIREEYDKWVSIRKVKEMWSFYIGHLPGVLEHCKKIGVEVQIIGEGCGSVQGEQFTDYQIMLLKRAEIQNIFFLFDPEKNAQEQAEKMAYQVSPFINHTECLYLNGDKDPGELSPEDVKSLRKQVFGRIW